VRRQTRRDVFNPKGIASSSPEVASLRATLGKMCRDGINPERVAPSTPRDRREKWATTLSGLVDLGTFSQDSSFLATSGLCYGIPSGFVRRRASDVGKA